MKQDGKGSATRRPADPREAWSEPCRWCSDISTHIARYDVEEEEGGGYGLICETHIGTETQVFEDNHYLHESCTLSIEELTTDAKQQVLFDLYGRRLRPPRYVCPVCGDKIEKWDPTLEHLRKDHPDYNLTYARRMELLATRH